MQVQPMSMDPRVAAIHFKDYRKKVRQHREERLNAARLKDVEGNKLRRASYSEKSLIEKEDEVLMESYRVMAQGQRIINVASVMHGAGRNKQHLPKLAIGLASWKEVFLVTRATGMAVFNATQWPYEKYNNGNRVGWKDGAISFPQHTFGAELSNAEWRTGQNLPALPVKAIVPSIPLYLRPAGDLSQYHVLWEAEWTPSAPVDPLLLKHVAGQMYSVLAQWDLTDIERSVLEGRIS